MDEQTISILQTQLENGLYPQSKGCKQQDSNEPATVNDTLGVEVIILMIQVMTMAVGRTMVLMIEMILMSQVMKMNVSRRMTMLNNFKTYGDEYKHFYTLNMFNFLFI